MAKQFLTNINLKGNQLINAVIHSAPSAPSALAAGQLYFNTGDSTFYYSTASGTANWSPVGVQYISSVGTNLSVTDGQLNVDLTSYLTTTDAGTTYLTQTNAGTTYLTQTNAGTTYLTQTDAGTTYLTQTDAATMYDAYGAASGVAGDLSSHTGASSGVHGVTGSVVGTTDTQTLSNKTFSDSITLSGSGDFTITADSNIVLSPSGASKAYIGSSSNPDNQIATFGDITGDLTGYVTETGTQTLTNKTIDGGDNTLQNIPNSSLTNSKVTINGNDVSLGSSTTLYTDDISEGVSPVNVYFTNSRARNAISGSSGISYDSTTGVVSVDRTTVDTWYDAAGTAATEAGYVAGDLSTHEGLSSGVHGTTGSVVGTSDTQTLSNKDFRGETVFHAGNGAGSLAIDLNSSTGAATITNNNDDLTITTNGGDIVLSPSTGIIDATSDNAEMHLRKTEYWNSGTQYGVITNNSNTFKQVATAGDFDIESNNGDINLRANNNVSIQTSTGDIVLNADGNSYINSVSDGNRIAKISDIHASTAGLSVKNSVAAASTGANIPLTGTYTTSFKIDNYPLETGDRVLLKDQSDDTANGIYVVTITDASHYSLSRAEDQLTPAEGDFTFVSDGDTWQKTGWIVNDINAGAVEWTQFSAAGEYTAGTGITISGNEISVTASTYDAYGSAGTAESNAKGYTDTLIGDLSVDGTTGNTVTDRISSAVSALNFAGGKFTASIIGDDVTDLFSFTHSFDTKDVVVRVYQTSPGTDQYADVEVDIKRTSNNAISIAFAMAPATGENYSVVIVG